MNRSEEYFRLQSVFYFLSQHLESERLNGLQIAVISELKEVLRSDISSSAERSHDGSNLLASLESSLYVIREYFQGLYEWLISKSSGHHELRISLLSDCVFLLLC